MMESQSQIQQGDPAPASIPDGWQAVPIMATEAMLRPFYGCPPEELHLAWQAALYIAAIPSPVRQGDEAVSPAKTMTISYERVGRCFWHIGCTEQGHSPPMWHARDEAERSLIRCTACNQAGWYPVGAVGERCCPIEAVSPVDVKETKTDQCNLGSDSVVRDLPAPLYAKSFGYSLAMRVMQSNLYQRLHADERAQCDELIARGQSTKALS